MPEAFHFLYPHWLWALLPLPVLLWGLRRREVDVSAWRGVIQPHLLPHLMSVSGRHSRLPLVLLAVGWILAVLALADPAWERQLTPLLKSREARVVVLDLSQSMTTPDLLPSRLTRARFKVADILARSRDGQSGLVAFAGDAFVVSPLTEDGATIAALLAALEPGIMPVQGSRADLGLKKAAGLLTQAGIREGEVLLVADEADERAQAAARSLREQGYRVSVLGVGTAEGAPLPDGRGGVVSGPDGIPVVVTLVDGPLRAVAQAGGGRYAPISADDADLKRLLPAPTNRLSREAEATDIEGERWHEQGPLLVLLLLPLAALAFRRGWLAALAALTLGSFTLPDPALAFGWDDLWQRPDQQAAAALQAGDAARAAALARDPLQQGAALYRSGELSQAVERFSLGESADAHYNRGNALANLGEYSAAIAAYDEALARQPGMEDAAYNRAQVEALLKQRQAQSQPSPQGQGQPQAGEQGGSDQAQSGNGQRRDQPQPIVGQDGAGTRGAAAQEPVGATDAEAPQGSVEPQQTASGQSGQQDPQSAPTSPTDTAARADPKGAPQDSAVGVPSQAESGLEPDRREGKPTDVAESSGDSGQGRSSADAEPLNTEQRQAIDQWLRRIPDDPGGLLRRKFLYQYRERTPQAAARGERPW